MSAVADDRVDLLSVVEKALSPGETLEISQALTQEDEAFRGSDALPCPYPPELLIRLFEKSSALRPCVDAMTTNVHGHGHRWVPAIDLKSSDSATMLAESIRAERLADGDDDPPDPTPAEVDERRQQVARGIQIEELRMKTFIAACTTEGFQEFRKRVGADYEITGNAFIEVLRNNLTGKITQLVHIPVTQMRLRARDPKPVHVQRNIKAEGAVRYGRVDRQQHFRSYVQRVLGTMVVFKEFGDPRPRDKRTGQTYEVGAELPASFQAATEIIHLAEHSGRSSYGVPRWVGATFEVLGLRAASEMNHDFFDNNGIPPYIFTVSNGSLKAGAEKMIAAHIQAKIKGRRNHYTPLILEAESTGAGGVVDPGAAARTQINAIPMRQPTDGTHLAYMAMCENVVAQQWRLSPISRGRTDGAFNFATAKAAMKKDEEQVFAPARSSFDEMFDRLILADLGIRYIRFESNSPAATDSEVLTTIIDVLVKNGTLTPEEARQSASAVLNRELPQIDAPWTKQPIPLTLAGIPVADPAAAPALPSGTGDQAAELQSVMQRLLTLRDTMAAQQRQAFDVAQAKALRAVADGEDVEVITVPASVLSQWVTLPNAA